MKIGDRVKIFLKDMQAKGYVKDITKDKKFAIVQIIGGSTKVIRIKGDM